MTTLLRTRFAASLGTKKRSGPWPGMNVAIVVLVVAVGCLLTYISSQRTFRRKLADLRQETELQLDALTGTIKALQKQVAELGPPLVIKPATAPVSAPLWSKKLCVGLNSSKVTIMVSGVLLIEAADNPRPVHKLCHHTQHPKQDHRLKSPRARPEPLPALSFDESQQVVQKQKEK